MRSQQYLTEIKIRFTTSPAIAAFEIIKERALPNQGYFRARLTLVNGDFLEVVEYFVVDSDRCRPERYRHQWMDGAQQTLRKRWDNVEHFPNLPNFPHHIHIDEETNVHPGVSMSIIVLLDAIEAELKNPS